MILQHVHSAGCTVLARYSIRKVGFLRGMGWLMLRREVGAGVVGIHSTFSTALARNLAP